MRLDEFDFDLPEDRIALRPAEPRDAARLLVVRGDGHLEDRIVRDLPDLLAPGDLLILNDTKVIPAHLEGERQRGESVVPVSATLIERVDDSQWWAFARPGRRLAPGDRISFGHEGRVCLLGTLEATVEEKAPDGRVRLAFSFHGPFLDEALRAVGAAPLPPYIASRRRADERDLADYQTIYAVQNGAVAAPTAGLHFTQGMFDRLEAAGIGRAFLTLHVGAGTFLPVKEEEVVERHRMQAEFGTIDEATAERVNAARAGGGRVVAVGTTALRLLESAADEYGRVRPYTGETELFITPGYRFRAVDLLMTNFHLPRSTLFMLVAAFSDLDRMKAAYRHAVAAGYRFYSYGDACLLFRSDGNGRRP